MLLLFASKRVLLSMSHGYHTSKYPDDGGEHRVLLDPAQAFRKVEVSPSFGQWRVQGSQHDILVGSFTSSTSTFG